MVQMSHVEVSKEEKLADTMRGWYANAKARQAEYAQQLACVLTHALKGLGDIACRIDLGACKPRVS